MSHGNGKPVHAKPSLNGSFPGGVVFVKDGKIQVFAEDKPIPALTRKPADEPQKLPTPSPEALRQAPQAAKSGDVALPGQDGQAAGELLRNSLKEGVDLLTYLTRNAVKRLLREPMMALGISTLFDPHEQKSLANAIAATNSTAELLGRARIRLRQKRAEEMRENFSEDEPTSFASFVEGDELKPLSPERAVAYFKSLVPTIGVRHPELFGAEMRRKAFTLARQTDKTILERVKEVILEALSTGQKISAAPHDIQRILDATGLAPQNPHYATTVWRTNILDAYNQGAEEERMQPSVLAVFPVWRYLGIHDGREGDDHRPHFNNYYPAAVSFASIRNSLVVRHGRVVPDPSGRGRPFQCRCGPQAISKFTWAKLKARGAKIADGYQDPTVSVAPHVGYSENWRDEGVLAKLKENWPGGADDFEAFAAKWRQETDAKGPKWVSEGGAVRRKKPPEAEIAGPAKPRGPVKPQPPAVKPQQNPDDVAQVLADKFGTGKWGYHPEILREAYDAKLTFKTIQEGGGGNAWMARVSFEKPPSDLLRAAVLDQLHGHAVEDSDKSWTVTANTETAQEGSARWIKSLVSAGGFVASEQRLAAQREVVNKVAAESDAKVKAELESPEYVFARESSIPNAGEDLLGSARHKRNSWRGLREAEKDGTAEELVTRQNLMMNEPLNLMANVNQDNFMAGLAAHLAMNKFPPTPSKEKRPLKPEDAVRARELYVDAYRTIKAAAEQAAVAGLDPIGATPYRTLEAIQKVVKAEMVKIHPYRNTVEGGVSAKAAVYNGLVRMANSLIPSRRAKPTSVEGQMQEFSKRVQTKYDGLQPSSASADNREKMAGHVKDIMEGQSWNKSFGEKAGTGNKIFNPADHYVAHAQRRDGPDIVVKTPEEGIKYLTSQLGMRGLQWGNSVTDEERGHHAKMSAEAFADLTDILGLPKEFSSLGGKLGLAIGARGKGTALAHYEPGNKVINLTRKGGVGSLAHEWAHFFDHAVGGGGISMEFGRRGSATYYSQKEARSHYDRTTGKLTDRSADPMFQAYEKLREAWRTSGFRQRLHESLKDHVRTGQMSKEKAEYWRSNEEVFARAFERHVQRKLEKSDRQNTYLAGVNKHPFWPTDDEVDAIAPQFDRIMELAKNHPGLVQKMAEMLKFAEARDDLIACGASPKTAAKFNLDPDKTVTRLDFAYREAEDMAVRCGTCAHYEEDIPGRLGSCVFFKCLYERDKRRFNLREDVGAHMLCGAFEAKAVNHAERDESIQWLTNKAEAFVSARNRRLAETFAEPGDSSDTAAALDKLTNTLGRALVAGQKAEAEKFADDSRTRTADLNRLAAALEKQKPVVVNVAAPMVKPADIIVKAPVVNVKLPEMKPTINLPAGKQDINIQLPPVSAPDVVVNPVINVPEANVEVTVDVPLKNTTEKITWDSTGERIVSVEKTEHKQG